MNFKGIVQISVLSSLFVMSSFAYAITYENKTSNTNNKQTTTNQTNRYGNTTTNQTANSEEIIKNVKSKLSADKITSDLNLNVTVQDNNNVALTGNVNTDAEASRAVEIAESVQGVNDVITDNLKVKESQQPLTDTYITAKVRGSFIREKLFGDKDVSVMGVAVETTNGIVYLVGNVESQEQAANAVKIAKTVKGVKNVESKLVVRQSRDTQDDQMKKNNQNDMNQKE